MKLKWLWAGYVCPMQSARWVKTCTNGVPKNGLQHRARLQRRDELDCFSRTWLDYLYKGQGETEGGSFTQLWDKVGIG